MTSTKLAPVGPKPAPDRAGAGRSPTWGETRPKRASWGRAGGLRGFVGRLAEESSPSAGRNARDAKFRWGGVGGICVTCWEIHRDARGESVGHFSSRVPHNAGELDLQHTKYRILFTVTCPPCTLLMGSEQERKSKQGGSQPVPSFQRHLRHWQGRRTKCPAAAGHCCGGFQTGRPCPPAENGSDSSAA